MKIVKIVSVSLLVLLCSNICFASTGIVNTPAVRIREKASTDSKIVTKAYEDDEIEILGEEGDWYKVKFEGKEGYASKSLIKEKNSNSSKNETINNSATNTNTNSNTNAANTSTTNTNTSNSNTASTNESASNNTVSNNNTSNPSPSSEENDTINNDTVIRVMPNFASNEIRLLTKDTKVEVIRELNNWCEISLENTTGWVLKNKVNSEAVPTVAEPQTPPETNTTPAENTVSDNTSKQNTVTNESKNNTVANNTSNDSKTNTDTANTTTSNNATSTDNSRNGKGKINVETANVRAKATTSSAILNCLDIGDEVTIVAEEGDWYKITSSKVESGYVSKSLVTVSDVSNRSAVREESETEVTDTTAVSKGTDVVTFAKQYLGYSYVLGGKTPDSGFDCSGYTRYVFKNFGYSLGTVAAEQNNLGREVDRNELQEGDLILFYNEQKTKIGHTGIYIGNNEFIHAANPDRGVVTDNLQTNSYYNERFVTARRIVE